MIQEKNREKKNISKATIKAHWNNHLNNYVLIKENAKGTTNFTTKRLQTDTATYIIGITSITSYVNFLINVSVLCVKVDTLVCNVYK